MFSRFLSISSFLLVLFPALTSGDFTIDQNDVDFHGGMQYKGSWNRIVCHCGHSNCDGTMTFSMSQSGSFHVYVKGAEWKSQGATQCKLSINGNQVASGEFKDSNGSKCGNSGGDSDFYIINGQTIDLGSHSFQSGDKVKYWSNTAFQCGTSGPGSYSAFTHLLFKGSGTVEECGNGTCGNGEDCSNCPQDCGQCGPQCGNGECESGEDCSNCPNDCGECEAECGNGECESGEGCASCPDDCGECPAIDAFSKIDAVDYSDQSGTQKESGSEGGEAIGYAAGGDWLLFKNVDFGDGANTVEARVATAESGGIDFVIDGQNGTRLGSISSSGTGGWTAWETVSASLDKVTGKHDLYLKWTGGSMNLYWIQFSSENDPVGPQCGNGDCEDGEDCSSCEQDCGACDTPVECGNGECEEGETCGSCPNDCGECETVDAFSEIKAANYADQSGTEKESCSEGGESIGFAADGDWIKFVNVDFGDGANTVDARIASAESGGIDFVLDALDGTKLGSVSTSGTGGWEAWETVSANIENTTGTHGIYLKWTGQSVNLNWITFGHADATPVTALMSEGDGRSGLRLDGGSVYLSDRKGTYRTLLLHRVNGERVAVLRTGAAAVPVGMLLPERSFGLYVLTVIHPGNVRESVRLIAGDAGSVALDAAGR